MSAKNNNLKLLKMVQFITTKNYFDKHKEENYRKEDYPRCVSISPQNRKININRRKTNLNRKYKNGLIKLTQ